MIETVTDLLSWAAILAGSFFLMAGGIGVLRFSDFYSRVHAAGITLMRNYKLDAPKGVRGRYSDNTLIKQKLGWAPSIRLEDGMAKTYAWIYDQMTG